MQRGHWELDPSEIKLCKRADGMFWQLGMGAFGTVYKAIWADVQAVAVRKLLPIDSSASGPFFEEVARVKAIGSDPNVVEFFGACMSTSPMLVLEFMEVRALQCRH